MVFLGRKKEGDDLEMVLEEENASSNNNNNIAKDNKEIDKNNVRMKL